jgi:ribulokinase
MAHLLLGLDYGTGGAKACLIDGEGQVLGYAFEEYPLIHEHPGWSEHEPTLYWEAACRLIPQILSEGGVTGDDVRGVAVSSALPSLVMVDGEGSPIHRAYNLMDRRATDVVAWLKAEVGEARIFQLSGYRLEDHPALVNLLWEQRHRPDSFSRIHTALTIDGYVTMKLTGRETVHDSGGAFFGVAYDLRERQFDEAMLGEIGIDPDILPEVHRCTDIVGEVTGAAAEATGLAAGTSVAAGQVDCNASWVGAGAIEVGDFQSNLGSVGNFGVVHRDSAFNFSEMGQLMINFPYTVDSANTYVTVPTTMTGGQCLRFLRDGFSPYEREVERTLDISAYDLLTLQAAEVPPGSEGLIMLPFLMGERTPIWDANARGVAFGLSLHHTKGHLVRAMMEGVAYAMYDSFRLIQEAGLQVNYPMVLNEGGAVSRLWRQIIADVFDVPIVLAKRREGAPFGDAILAGVATGLFDDFSVAKSWAEYVEPMDPDPESHAVYMAYFDLYKQLYEDLREDFGRLAVLRSP